MIIRNAASQSVNYVTCRLMSHATRKFSPKIPNLTHPSSLSSATTYLPSPSSLMCLSMHVAPGLNAEREGNGPFGDFSAAGGSFSLLGNHEIIDALARLAMCLISVPCLHSYQLTASLAVIPNSQRSWLLQASENDRSER